MGKNSDEKLALLSSLSLMQQEGDERKARDFRAAEILGNERTLPTAQEAVAHHARPMANRAHADDAKSRCDQCEEDLDVWKLRYERLEEKHKALLGELRKLCLDELRKLCGDDE